MLDGRYRIIGLLGRGGMGEVYRADDLRLGQPVALKFLPDALRDDPVRLAQFHNEVRTARQVSHPNVCRVYDIGEVDGLLYLSMEYVDGEDLATSLRRIGRFPEDKATEIARQLCAGLAAAHERGVLHRDLKPANVMLDGAGQVRIMDFGLAAVGAVEDIRAGTPAYMAPEQLLGREVTQRSDIYALGLVLYELFTGRRAFTATTVGELVEQHERDRSHRRRGRERARSRDRARDPALPRSRSRAAARFGARGVRRRCPAAIRWRRRWPPARRRRRKWWRRPARARASAASLRGRARGHAAGLLAAFALALRDSPLDRMRPEFSPDVLAQKARDAIAAARLHRAAARRGVRLRVERRADSAVVKSEGRRRVGPVLTQRPSPLQFWYRQSSEPLDRRRVPHTTC